MRVHGGTASVSLILLDASGEKTIATRRGVNLGKVLPTDAARLVAEADAVLVDNRFPEFVTAMCRAAQARKIPVVIDLDQATKPDDALLKLGSHVMSSAEALHGTHRFKRLRRRLARWPSTFRASSPSPTGRRRLLARKGALRHMPAFKVKAIDTLGAGDAFHGAFTLRWRKAAMSKTPCALPAPPRRSNARVSAAARARPAAPRWTNS